MTNKKIFLMGKILTFLFIIVLVWALALQINPDKKLLWNYFFNSGFSVLFLFGGFVSIWSSNKLNIKGIPRLVLGFLGLSLIFYGLGLNIWTYYNITYGESVPYPALPDAFFIFFYPLALFASFYFLKLFSFLISEKNIIQSVLMLVVLSILILGVFIRPDISEGLSFWANVLNVYYPLMSAVILTMALTILRVSGGESTRSAMFLSLGLATHAISTFFFALRTASGDYWNGDYTDVLLATSAYLIAMAGISMIVNLIPKENSPKKQNVI